MFEGATQRYAIKSVGFYSGAMHKIGNSNAFQHSINKKLIPFGTYIFLQYSQAQSHLAVHTI